MGGKLVPTKKKFYYMDETWINKNHHQGFTWKRAVNMGSYADKDGKINRLPVGYEGDMDLPTGKGERLILLHFRKNNFSNKVQTPHKSTLKYLV